MKVFGNQKSTYSKNEMHRIEEVCDRRINANREKNHIYIAYSVQIITYTVNKHQIRQLADFRIDKP